MDPAVELTADGMGFGALKVGGAFVWTVRGLRALG